MKKWIIGAVISTMVFATASFAENYLIVGIDQKITWDETGATVMRPDNHEDKILFFDVSRPMSPILTREFQLQNSIYGPPSNIAVTPDGNTAFVANSVDWVESNGQWSAAPTNEIHVFDLTVSPPEFVHTISAGFQPSGLAVNHDGSLLMVANRAATYVTAVHLAHGTVVNTENIEVGAKTAAVDFAPDGSRAFFVVQASNKVGVLQVGSEEITYNPGNDINVGVSPYNIKVSPAGNVALVNCIGATGGNDGHADVVSVIDIQAEPPRVIDHVAVGDGPEGMAFSPDGRMAVIALINGSQNAQANPDTAWAYNSNGKIVVLGFFPCWQKHLAVKKIQEIEVGGMPEGVYFEPTGKTVYVGNFLSDSMSMFRVAGRHLIERSHEFIELPGQPASMGGTR